MIREDKTLHEMTCKYIENLVKKYKNDCLFVFTYDMENPGFSYYLLPELKKYLVPITLREGSGDRKAAIKYLKELIKDSELAKYAGQADEFMKSIPGTKFSQTDVMQAFNRFESWCLKKNVLQTYDYSDDKNFMLDRDENVESSYES